MQHDKNSNAIYWSVTNGGSWGGHCVTQKRSEPSMGKLIVMPTDESMAEVMVEVVWIQRNDSDSVWNGWRSQHG